MNLRTLTAVTLTLALASSPATADIGLSPFAGYRMGGSVFCSGGCELKFRSSGYLQVEAGAGLVVRFLRPLRPPPAAVQVA